MSIESVFGAIEKTVSLLSSVVLVAVMTIVSIDVFMRYALNSPLRWSYDSIALYGLVAIFYFSVSSAYAQNYHLRLDVLYGRFSERARTLVNIGSVLVTLPLILWLVVINGEEAWRAFTLGLAQSGRFAWPTWPVRAMVCIGFALLGIRLLIDLSHNAAALAGHSAPRRDGSSE